MVEVDHDLNGAKAAGYRSNAKRIERMLAAATGKGSTESVSTTVEKTPSMVTQTVDIPSFTPRNEVREVIRYVEKADDNTVTISNDNIAFEVAYPYDTKLMSVGLKAMSVDVSEDSVSILVEDVVQIKLPKLEPLYLSVEGKAYKVCWAGGSHKFGRFRHISFVVVE